MSQESLQDRLWPQHRKRPPPALALGISDDDSEDRPQGRKVPKLSGGAEDELMKDLTHSCGRGESISCFGMIVEKVSNIRLDVLGPSDGARIDVALKVSRSSIIVRHHDNMAYGGLLHRDLAKPLIEILEQRQVTLVAFLLGSAKGKDVPRASDSCQLCIIVYGIQEASRDVGEVLDHAGVYLQHPLSYDPTIPYTNPHYLVRPGGAHPAPSSEEQFKTSTRPSVCLSTDQRLKGEVSQLINDSAQGPSSYSTITPSPQMRTTLKPHQFMALSMMVEKESGKVEGNEFENLWSRVTQRDGKVRYKNAVTDSARADAPPLCLGGLLADDMGLGKTLTTLALIMRSLDNSSQFSQPSSEGVRWRPTLIVTPLSLLGVWDEQIRRHIHPQKIKWLVYHGTQRRRKVVDLMTYDIVLTTYDTVVGEGFKRSNGANNEAKLLHACEWLRVVLDEAHLIRNASSKRHRALLTLKARHRWCLTGTPLFNQIEDLGALLTFLKAYPFDSASYFNLHISTPLGTNPEKALTNLRKLFRCTSLRRTKDAVIDELQLPTRIDTMREVQLNENERRLYDVLKRSLSYFFYSISSDVDKTNSGSNVLQTITRLRQFCNHGLYLLPRETQVLFGDVIDEEEMTRALMTGSQKCDSCDLQSSAIDLRKVIFRAVLCGHTICSQCLPERESSNQSCPLCFSLEVSDHPSNNAQDFELTDIYRKYQPSSKVLALLENLSAEQKMHPTVKRLDLTAASRVHLLEPQWSPMAEEQAIDRVHRMGQRREVVATRYIVKDSIEEHVVLVQRNKSEIITRTMSSGEPASGTSLKDCLIKHLDGA